MEATNTIRKNIIVSGTPGNNYSAGFFYIKTKKIQGPFAMLLNA